MNRDWWTLTQEHAQAVERESRAYQALTRVLGASTASADETDLDPELVANWERAKHAVTCAWERLHRHALNGNNTAA